MSFCHKCGKELTDDALYCPNCGERVPAQSAPYQASHQNYGDQPQPQMRQAEPHRQYGGQPPHSERQSSYQRQPAVSVLKGALSSRVVLAAAICYSASLFFNLIYFLFSSTGIAAAADYLYYITGINLGGLFILICIFSIALGAAAAAGVWLVYTSAANRQIYGFNVKGLTLIKVVLIIQLVFACIFIVIALIATFIAITALSSYSSGYGYYASGYKAMFILSFFLIIIIAVFLILFSIKTIRCANIISQAAATGSFSGKPSMYVAVYLFVLGAFMAICMFGSQGAIAVFGLLFGAAAEILFGICVLRIRNIIAELHINS